MRGVYLGLQTWNHDADAKDEQPAGSERQGHDERQPIASLAEDEFKSHDSGSGRGHHELRGNLRRRRRAGGVSWFGQRGRRNPPGFSAFKLSCLVAWAESCFVVSPSRWISLNFPGLKLRRFRR